MNNRVPDTLPLIQWPPIAVQGRIDMGKGDKRTRRGKLFRGSYGKTRPGRPNKKKKKGKQ